MADRYRSLPNVSAALLKDVGTPPPLLTPHNFYDKTVMWIAREGWRQGRQSALHFDPNDNLMHLAFGEKYLLLASPSDSALLYADFAKSEGMSPIDANAVDLGRFPLAAGVPLHEAHLRAGDILFIPATWWHFVVSSPIHRHVALTVQFSSREVFEEISHARRPVDHIRGFSPLRAELQALRERSGRYYASDLPNAPMEAGQYPSLGDVFAEQIREITEGVRGL